MFISEEPDLFAEARAVLNRIPRFAGVSDLRVASMPDVISLNNTNFRVDCGDKSYFLRIGAGTARLLGINRADEIAASRAAAKAGVGPDVLYSEPDGVMLTPFIEGRHWLGEDFHVPANIERIARTLRRLHAITDAAAPLSHYRRIEQLLDNAVVLNQPLPSGIDRHRRRLAEIERQRLARPGFVPALAHNDLWANNFLDDGDRLYLLDWEFAGIGDTLVDLATLSMAGRYSEDEQRRLLAACGLNASDDFADLQKIKWVVTFFEAAWALVLHGLRGSDTVVCGDGTFNYEKHAHQMFERLDAV